MTVLPTATRRTAARDPSPDLRRRKLALPLALLLVLTTAPPAAALGPSTSPAATPAFVDPPVTDPGLILVLVVFPVVLVALIWLGYIFWLIFHEGENVGSGDPLPPESRRPSNRRPEPPDQPGSVG